MNRVGIDALSMLGQSPVESVRVAADLGCAHVSLMLRPLDFTKFADRSTPRSGRPLGYEPFDLVADTALRRELRTVLDERAVSVSLAEGLTILASTNVPELAAELDVFAELGATRVLLMSRDPDLSRTCDRFASMMELAAERGIEGVIEFVPGLVIPDLETALDSVRRVGRPDVRLLIDAMHTISSGSSISALSKVDPELIGYFQICDARLPYEESTYLSRAISDRMIPGEGDLPLLELLELVPKTTVIGIEVPLLPEARAGIDSRDRLRPVVEATRRLLDRMSVG